MKALKLLSDIDYQAKREAHKSVPDYAIPKTKFSDKTANGLTKSIQAWLNLHGHYCTRINTTGRKLKDTTVIDVIGRAHITPGKWIPGTTRKGTADIHAVIKGVHVSIEVKVGKDRMSPEQHKTKEAIEKSGGLYFIAKDFESFHTWYVDLIALDLQRAA
jgi:hypothetical protein